MKIILNKNKLISIALVTLVLSSCVPNTGSSLRGRDSSNGISASANVGIGQGKILADNPIILSKTPGLSESYDMNKLLSTATITGNTFLRGNSSCLGLEYCFEVRDNRNSVSPLQTTDGKWGFNANSNEFLQVNTFYHLNKVTEMFYGELSNSYSNAYDQLTLARLYDTALPLSFMPSPGVFRGQNLLTAYSNCDEADNAYFESANGTLCFGYISDHPKVKWSQDSTVIYHEAGHFFQRLQLNIRNNGTQGVDMGSGYYDEAGAIGEGLSDYYSYFVNGRTHFAEWGAGRFLNASRPIKEDDRLHTASLSNDPDQRLSYPQYLGYDPNRPSTPVEGIHVSGMILSHYLVALTEDLQSKCLMSKRNASNMVLHLLNETLAEHGDLTSKATENNLTGLPKINMSSAKSYDWFSKVNPINYRSFMQTFAKNILNNLGNPTLNRCNGSVYPQDQIESLIDQYGLLLFRTYNENRNLSTAGSNTPVNSINRKKSLLISKNLLILDPTINASIAYVIDNMSQIKNGITTLQASGLNVTLSSQTPSDFSFNNNNGKVSPGEVVALALNLYNNSNSTMGGIQVLASDWNHADSNGRPYRFDTTMSSDQWPLLSEGGIAFTPDTNPAVPALGIKATDEADFAPVCFIQLNENSSTKWVSQKEFKTKMALDRSSCLDPSAQKDGKDCFIRAIRGADQAIFSKLNPKSTWAQTMADPTSGKAPTIEWGNVMFFEVSKHIPPGTVIDCRLRARFTNCDDCYHDSTKNNYDYSDTDYNGPRPFKIIHLPITVID